MTMPLAAKILMGQKELARMSAKVLSAVLLYSRRKKPYIFPVFSHFVKNRPVSKHRKSFGTGSL
jgi:hypothetical protein